MMKVIKEAINSGEIKCLHGSEDSVLPRCQFSLNRSPNPKILAEFLFVKIDKLFEKFIWKSKGTQIPKII